MQVTQPVTDKTVTVETGKVYRVTYYQDPDDASDISKITEKLMFLCKDTYNSIEGLRFFDYTSSDATLSDFWRPIALKDIVRIESAEIGDKVIEMYDLTAGTSILMADITASPYVNDLTKPGTTGGAVEEYHIIEFDPMEVADASQFKE